MDFDFTTESITPTQTTSVLISSTGALGLPFGTTANRPANLAGLIRWNSDLVVTEFNNGTSWVSFGTVSSVSVTGSTGLTVGGSPITSSGTVTLTLGTELQGLSGLAVTGLIARTGSGTFSPRTITGTGSNISVVNGDGIAGNPTIDLVNAGTSVTGQFVSITTDTKGRVTATAAATQANITTALGYTPVNKAGDTMASAANLTFTGGGTVTGIPTPISGTDVANKNYVDALQSGLAWKQAAAAASTVSLTVTYSNGTAGVGATLTNAGAQAAFVIDGYTTVVGDRILIKNQASAFQNGVYQVTAIGSGVANWILTRVFDGDVSTEFNNLTLFVTSGTQSNTGWTQVTSNPTIGTSNIVFNQFSGAGTYVAGAGLTLTGNTFSITSPIATTLGGTGLTTIGSSNQILGSNNAGTALEYKTIIGGTSITAVNAAGSITINNTGVTSAIASTGISVSGATGAVTFTNTGVTAIAGTTNQITASASTGSVTLSLPSALVAPGSLTVTTNLTVSGLTANTFIFSGTAGLITATAAPTNGQLLIGSTGGAPVSSILTAGTSISVVNAAGSITINNTGVTSAIASTGISVSGATGAVTFTNTGVTAIAGTTNQITASASTGSVTLSLPSALVAPGSVAVTGALYQSQSATVSAAGSTQGTATAITSSYNIVTTAAAGTGVILPTPVTPFGYNVTVLNRGANPVIVYPQTGGSIDGGTVNAGVTVPTGYTLSIVGTSATAWFTTEQIIIAGSGITIIPTAGTLTVTATAASLAIIKENPVTPTTPLVGGTNAVAIGSGSSATAATAYANGDGTDSRLAGGKVFGNGRFATAGDAQAGLYLVRNSTTTAAATDLFMDGSTTRIALPNNSVFLFELFITARRTDATGGQAGYKFEGVMKRDGTAATTAIVGTISKTIIAETNAAWDATITADTTNGAFKITCTGEAAKTIRWAGVMNTVEVTN